MTRKKANPIRIYATDDLLFDSGRRLRVRQVDEHHVADYVLTASHVLGAPEVYVHHGGGVANAYNYPAVTEGIVSVGFPDGSLVQWGARLSANKVTNSGVLFACLGSWARPYGDLRFDIEAQAEARRKIIEVAEARINRAESARKYKISEK